MSLKSASALEADRDDSSDAEPEFVEVDPSGRYGRYKEVLGKGAFKKVYRAFDEWEGIEVAWNQVKVSDLLRNTVDLERLYSEVHLLKTLKNKNIIKFYHSWVDTKNEHINFITEIFTSGTLRQYRKKHKHVDARALKKWSRQILEGLAYLHCCDPPVIHRDLKCDNIFVNGNQGEVKIGDLGLAAILHHARAAHSVIGTPEFMAPELYEEEYNELVDIYAFGMCLLELVTLEYPYAECANAAQIYKKVTAGIKPASLGKVKDPGVREFIEKCIANVSERLSAKELLVDSFLQSDEDSRNICYLLRPQSLKADGNQTHLNAKKIPEETMLMVSRDFTVQGQRKDQNSIFLRLQIADTSGHIRNIHFPFDIEEDTSTDVASEMVEELDLTDHDVSVIAAMIDSEVRSIIPDSKPRQPATINRFDDEDTLEAEFSSDAFDTAADSYKSSSITLERLPSGREFWSDSYKPNGPCCSLRSGPSNLTLEESVSSTDSLSRDAKNSVGVSLQCWENDFDHDGRLKSEHEPLPCQPQSGEIDRCVDVSGTRPPPLKEKAMPIESNSDDISTIVEMIEHVLDEQLNELKELKMKHDLAVLNLVKELPDEIQKKIISFCKQKRSEYKHDEKKRCRPIKYPDPPSSITSEVILES